ncbi:flavoprotein [Thermogladius sp. 4427co]|uniref:flavoprotein n=1 Tax=Thermogladius sp. 4427co TaxID=3450718 RepID=UPI003F796CC3
MKSIAWAITGSGVYLSESIGVIRELKEKGFSVTIYVSKAGEEVLRIYGFLEALRELGFGPYPNEVVFERDEGFSYPRAGRVYKGIYTAVVVSPASLNTVGKIVAGIADSLVTNLVSHAIKARVPVYIVPSDLKKTVSKIPLLIDRDKCYNCDKCIAATACPKGALVEDEYFKVRVNLLRCDLCGVCTSACPFNAIRLNVPIEVSPHPYYVSLIKSLEKIGGIKVLEHPVEVLDLLRGV